MRVPVAAFDEVGGRLRDDRGEHAAADEVLRTGVFERLAHQQVGAREGRRQQGLRPAALFARFPHGVPFDQLHRLDPRLAAAAPLDHALHGLEGVVIHRVGAADAHHQGVFDLAIERQFQLGQPPRDGERRAGEHREAEPLRIGHHLFRLGEAVREVLVVVDRHGAAGSLEDVDALL